MEIVVCVQQIMDTGVNLRVDEERRMVVQAEPDPVFLLDPADRAALEAAMAMAAAAPAGARVTALTLGPAEDEVALRYFLARGATHAVRIWAEALGEADPFQTALVLSRALSTLAPDLVLCGSHSAGGGSGQVPAALAEMLGLSQLSGVVGLELSGDRLRAQRRLERGNRLILESSLPALVAVEAGSFPERYVSVNAQRRAVQPIQQRNLADLGLSPADVAPDQRFVMTKALTPPRPRTKKSAAPAPAAGGFKAMLMGWKAPMKKPGSGGPLEGAPDYLAEEMVKFLQEKGFLPKG